MAEYPRFPGKADLPWVSRGLSEVERRSRWTTVEIPVLQYDRTVGTRVESIAAEWKAAGKRGRRYAGKTAYQSEDVMRSRTEVAKYVSHASRKAAIVILYPYRKPTQVDEERILRPAEEALSRNSAK